MITWVLALIAGYLLIAGIRFLLNSDMDGPIDNITNIEWANDHPYHVIYNKLCDSATALGFAVFFEIAYIVIIGLITCADFTPYEITGNLDMNLLLAWLTGAGLYTAIALAFDMHKYYTKWYFQAKDKFIKWYEAQKLKIYPEEIERVTQAEKLIKKILKGEETNETYLSLFAKIKKLKKQKIPELLRLRKKTLECIELARETIQSEKDNSILPEEESMMAESEENLATLKERFKNINRILILIPTILNHLSVRLTVIVTTSSTKDTEDLLNEVQGDLDMLLHTHTEIAALEAKYMQQDQAAKAAAIDEVNQAAAVLSRIGRERV